MKRFLLGLIFFNCTLISNSAVITWIGGSAGNWGTGSNWTGGTPPTSIDDVIFNTSTTVTLDVVPALNSLQVTGSSTVILASSVSRTIVLSSATTTPRGLQIDAGSTLTLDCTNASGTNNLILTLTGGAGVTGLVNGNLYFTSTGGSTSAAARFSTFTGALNYADMQVGPTGYIKFFTTSGNATTSATSFTMQSGATYEINKNGGSFPDGSWNSGSFAIHTGMTNGAPSFLGSIYGNLEWNCPLQTSTMTLGQDITFNNVDIVHTGTPSNFRIKGGTGTTTYTMTINGDLTVSNNAILETSGNTTTSGNPGIISVKGNIINNGIIRENSTVVGNEFQLTGTSNQAISGTGSWSGDALTFVMNNSAGATLNTPVTIPYNLTLTSGKITTTSTNLLTMVDNATVSGSSTTSFVNGPMKKIGDDPFLFPIGIGSILAPIGISGGTGAATDEFTAEYKRTNPQSIHGGCPLNCVGGLDHISYVEYWTLNQGVGSSSKQVTLSVTQYSFVKVLPNTFVSRWDGSDWTNESTFVSIGPISCGAPGFFCGTITTVGTLNSFGDFTLATDLSFLLNPLPIKLISFKAERMGNYASHLSWELAECCSKDARFEVQKSSDRRNFSSVSTIGGDELSRYYYHNDMQLGRGITYYRLKMIDADGKVTYSKTVAVFNDSKGLLITSLVPNPVQQQAVITLSAARQGAVTFEVYNIAGYKVKRWAANISEGTNTIYAGFGDLPAGVYHILATGSDTRTVLRFIKQ